MSVIGTETHRVLQTINVGGGPVALALSADGKTLYVANQHSNTVSTMPTDDLSQHRQVPVGFSPFALAVAPNGGGVYVANLFSASVSRVP